MGVGEATTTNRVHELLCRRPPARRVVPVIPARTPQYDAISNAVCRFELKLPIGAVDELKLFRRAIVILRPKIKIDRLAETKCAGFIRRCLGALCPCRLIVIKRVHRRKEGVDMAGEFPSVWKIGRRDLGQRIGTIKTNGLAGRSFMRPVGKFRKRFHVVACDVLRTLQGKFFNLDVPLQSECPKEG